MAGRGMHSSGIKPLDIYHDVMQLKVANIHASQSNKPGYLWGVQVKTFCIGRSAIEDGFRSVSLFPLLGLIVAAIPVDMGAELQRIIEGVVASGEADDMRRRRRSDGAGLAACPVDVSGVASGTAAGAASAAAGFHIPDATFTAGVLRP